MSDEARALRAALEEAQAELKVARAEVETLEADVRERRRLGAQVQRAQAELGQIQLREKELLNALLEAKQLSSPHSGLDDQLKALREEERSKLRLSARSVVLFATAVLILGLVALAVSNANLIDGGVIGGTVLVVATIGVAMYFIGPTPPQ